ARYPFRRLASARRLIFPSVRRHRPPDRDARFLSVLAEGTCARRSIVIARVLALQRHGAERSVLPTDASAQYADRRRQLCFACRRRARRALPARVFGSAW